ncbi:MAG: hypothetical protein ACXWDO_00785 [Bacteroidia bacterium]
MSLFLVGITLFSCNLKNPDNQKLAEAKSANRDTVQLIQGTWISVEDPRGNMQITDTKISNYYKKKLVGTDSYILSDTCKLSSQTFKNGFILKVNNDDTLCYQILAITDQTLSLLYLNRGNILAYHKK